MSDSEEYEYDDDDMEEEQEEEQFEYTDDEEQADDGQVALENQYYNSKSLRDDPVEAAASFERVIQMEAESGQPNGPWTFKARKQLTKLFLRHGDVPATMQHYRQLLDGISQPNNNDSNNNSSASTVSPNAIEKGIHAMLERVASLYQTAAATGSSSSSHPSSSSSSSSTSSPKDILDLALNVYDATLQVFHPHQGVCPNERLWFKTNLKYGQLLYEQNDTRKLQQVLQDLQSVHQVVDDNMDTTTTSGGGNASNSASSTQSLEIYALQMQLYSRQKENKKMRQVYQQAMQVRGSIPHPRTIAMIQELGGKNFMATKEYEAAEKTFFQAFKSYDEAGDIKRLRVLKYLVLASMLHASTINPFDSQEARPYRDDPEIVAMTNLVQAFHNNDINTFEKVVRQGRVMNDEFIREHIEDLLRTIRKQVLRRVIRPYSRISLPAIAKALNDIPLADVESLLVGLLLDGQLEGYIDRVSNVLYKQTEGRIPDGATSVTGGNGMNNVARNHSESILLQKCQAMDELLDIMSSVHSDVSGRVKENNLSTTTSSTVRGLVQF